MTHQVLVLLLIGYIIYTIDHGKPVGFSYRIQKGQLSKYITDVEVSIDG